MGADLTAQVAQATRLAVLGGVEQAEALKATISLTDAFGVAAEQLAGKIDFLNAVENQTVTSIEDLTIAIPKAGPVVQQLGGDVQDLTFFLTAMREGGINASEGANALKSGLASMINPTGKAAEMLQGFGINLKGIVDANKGDVKGIVIDFAKALDTLDPLNRAQAIEQLFGKFQFARLSTLFQNVIKEGNQASRVLKLANATTEELAILSERELKKVEDSPMFKFQKAVEDIKVTLVPLGEAFLKAVTPVLEFGTKILEKFNELDAGAKQFVVGLTAIAGVIGPVFLMGFGLIANGVANVIKGFVFFKTAMNKAGSASSQLGMQTEYMTQQQLEASAVAASLDQIHTKLTQTFTSEASAINNLTASYNRSIAAQALMTGGAIKRTRPPKKYASGVLSVPGPKGAGDVVPAMLSPGEAIIPAKQASKYSGFISSMISDNIPGFRFGMNPFASILGRSNVGVRMQSQAFSQALASGNKKYQSGFATGTGDDFLSKYGLKKPKQKKLRTNLEQNIFGLPGDTSGSKRPTYGFASSSPLQAILNTLLFGKTGARASGAMNPRSSKLDRYGDISLITKGSVAKRSSAYAGDILLDYSRNKNLSGSPAPMRGATRGQSQAAQFGRFEQPFGNIPTGGNSFTTNPKPPYIETYTPGGFAFKEIDKIIARNPTIAKQLRAELKEAGLGSVRVTGSNFAARLFKKMGIPGYKDGVFSVPGPKGAGDVVPSMLSPGEAVIPAKPAEKYASLIQSMIADNIPGFEKSNVKKKSGMVVKDVKLGSSTPSLPATSAKPSDVKAYTNATMFLSEQDNENLRAGKAGPEKLASSIKSGGALATSPLITEIVRAMGNPSQSEINKALKDPKLKKDLSSFATSFSSRLAAEVASSKAPIGDAKFSEIAGKIAREEAALRGKDFAKATEKVLTRPTTYEDNTTQRINEKGKARARGRSQMLSGVTSYRNQRESYKTTGAALGLAGTLPSKPFMAHITEPLKVSLAKFSGKLTTTAEQSRKLLEAGQKIVYREGDASKKITVPADTLAKESIAKLENETSKTNAKTVKQETKTVKAKAATAKVEKETQAGAKRADAARKGWETRRAKANVNQTINPDAPESGKRRMGSGTIGMVASGAVMAGSMMPGVVGEISQQLMMPVMLLSMMSQMLRPPLLLAVTAITAVVAGAIALKVAFDKAQDESMKLTEAMGGGAKSIKSFSEFSGKVSAGEIMDRRRESSLSQFSLQTGKTTFGESFVQSEAGKGMVSSAKQSISVLGKQPTESQLVSQLVTAVASGALDAMQARSIAANIAQEIGDYSFGINVNAKLIELLGPNGENLLNNPLEVRVKLIEETRRSVVGQQPNLTAQADRAAVASNLTGTAAIAGTAIGAGIGAGFGGVGAVPGAVVGGAIGGLIGAGATAFNLFDSLKGLGAASGAAVATGQIALQQQQEMVDSLDLQYERRIAEARAAGDTAKADGLTNQHLADRKVLLAENAKNTKAIVDMYKNENLMGKGAMGQAVDKTIEDLYANDPQQKALAIGARDQIVSASGLNQEQEFQMKLMLSTGDLAPQQVLGLLSTFGKDGKQLTTVLNVMTKLGAAEGNRALQLMNTFVDKEGNLDPVAQKTFMMRLESKDPTGAAKYLDMFAEASKLGGANIVKTDVVMDFYNNNPTKALEFQNMMDKIDAVDGKMSMDFVQNLIGDSEFEKFKQNQAYFESLPPQQQKDFISAYVNTMTMEGDPDMQAAWKSWVSTLPEGEKGKAFQDFAINTAVRVTEAGVDASAAATEAVKTPSSSSGGRKADPLDGILKSLQNIRKASINALGGTKELFKLFEKGKNISVFKGIENQLLTLTSNTDFASFISGLDKQEQKLFITIKKGNVELTNRGRLLEKAYRAKSVGDFVLSQQKLAISSKNELTARNLLIKAGYSYVEAVELSRDADIAAAYASAAATKGAKARKKAIEDVDKALRKGLAAQKATLTAEEQFDELYDKIQGKLDADKTAIELKFKLDSAADDKIIRDAENKIAGIQYKLDDQEAGLTLISDKEEVINEKYDKRLEALDKIKSVNDRISQQQKNQLSLADALSSGDIGAAAAAMQQIQQQFVSDSSAQQEDLIEKARQQELLKVSVLVNGELKTREQIEKTIKDLQKEIFEIEEGRLEPALENNRILIAARDEALLKLDQESDKWLAVKNSIEIAKYAALDYAQALRDANALALQAIAQINNPLAATGQEPVVPQDVAPKNDVKAQLGGTPAPTVTPDPLTQQQIIARDQAASQAAFKASGLSASGYIKQVEAKEAAKAAADKKAKIAADQKSSKAAQVKSGLSTAAYIKQVDAKAAAKPTGPALRALLRANGGLVSYMSNGGTPKVAKPSWAKTVGTDRIPAMLTPGEFVINRPAVSKIGVDSLKKINNGEYSGGSVYNYSVSVNVKTDANADQIAKTVMTQIKQIDSQRIRGVGLK
jgi:TP901 family phage tail tape measure protein